MITKPEGTTFPPSQDNWQPKHPARWCLLKYAWSVLRTGNLYGPYGTLWTFSAHDWTCYIRFRGPWGPYAYLRGNFEVKELAIFKREEHMDPVTGQRFYITKDSEIMPTYVPLLERFRRSWNWIAFDHIHRDFHCNDIVRDMVNAGLADNKFAQTKFVGHEVPVEDLMQ